ncbi:MAG: hypothetical protein HOV68_30855, partial [Streptomycetaceae bacterium]|nr:hypothetical protein [Streptomycetaceae bacterium]
MAEAGLELVATWPAGGPAPREVLFLGYSAEALAGGALPAARALGARVAVIGDAPYGVYPALGATAPSRGAVVPYRIVLLLGDDAIRLGVGAPGGLWTSVSCTGGA